MPRLTAFGRYIACRRQEINGGCTRALDGEVKLGLKSLGAILILF
jgi:hypothetical protein